jgi:hypothetical protein
MKSRKTVNDSECGLRNVLECGLRNGIRRGIRVKGLGIFNEPFGEVRSTRIVFYLNPEPFFPEPLTINVSA